MCLEHWKCEEANITIPVMPVSAAAIEGEYIRRKRAARWEGSRGALLIRLSYRREC